MVELYCYKIKVNKVSDGDTIEATIDVGFNIALMNKFIRLAGINTPEIRSKNPKLKEIAERSRNFLEGWFKKADYIILCSKSKQEDKYGRLLGEIIIGVENNEFNINELLIKEKLAIEYNGSKKLTEEEMLKALCFEKKEF